MSSTSHSAWTPKMANCLANGGAWSTAAQRLWWMRGRIGGAIRNASNTRCTFAAMRRVDDANTSATFNALRREWHRGTSVLKVTSVASERSLSSSVGSRLGIRKLGHLGETIPLRVEAVHYRSWKAYRKFANWRGWIATQLFVRKTWIRGRRSLYSDIDLTCDIAYIAMLRNHQKHANLIGVLHGVCHPWDVALAKFFLTSLLILTRCWMLHRIEKSCFGRKTVRVTK